MAHWVLSVDEASVEAEAEVPSFKGKEVSMIL